MPFVSDGWQALRGSEAQKALLQVKGDKARLEKALLEAEDEAELGAEAQRALLQAETDNARLEKALLEAEATICEETKATARLDDELKEV